MNQGKRTPTNTRVATGAQRQTDLFHPDYTVGFGLSPNLLTLPLGTAGARGLASRPAYRRWGIAPRPEIIARELPRATKT